MIKKILAFIERYEFLIVVLCLVALIRLPGLFEPNRYADEDIYLTIGRVLRKGLLLYRDIYDNKTPLIYVMAMVAGNIMWFRFILMIWNLINVALVWGLAKKLISKHWGMVVATVFFAVFSNLPLLEGEIANGEIFMIMPVAAALYLVFLKTGHLVEKKGVYFWSGVLWSVAFLFKSPPLVELFGLFFFMTVCLGILDERLWLLILGFLLPVLGSVFYFYVNDVGGIYLQSALLQNFSYLSSWGGGQKAGVMSLFSGSLSTRLLILFSVLAIIWAVRKKLGDHFAFLSIWMVTAIFGAFLSGRPYPHYLLEIVGPLALLIGFITTNWSRRTAMVGTVMVLLLAAGIVRYRFWYYRSLPYYQNFVAYVLGGKSKEEFYNFWGSNVMADYQAASYIDMVTNKDDKIFVWGTEPAIYVISNRLPVTKYTVSYHVLDFSAQGQVGEDLMREKPRVIVVSKNETGKFTELAGILNNNYVLANTFGELMVYLRLK